MEFREFDLERRFVRGGYCSTLRTATDSGLFKIAVSDKYPSFEVKTKYSEGNRPDLPLRRFPLRETDKVSMTPPFACVEF
jgi:hypothetical protein